MTVSHEHTMGKLQAARHGMMYLTLTTQQNFRLVQIESICKQHI